MAHAAYLPCCLFAALHGDEAVLVPPVGTYGLERELDKSNNQPAEATACYWKERPAPLERKACNCYPENDSTPTFNNKIKPLV